MTENESNSFIFDLKKNGFLQKTVSNESEFLFFSAPCYIRISEHIVKEVKENYSTGEERGGLMWAKPFKENNEIIYHIAKVSFIRNAIDEHPNKGDRTIKNAYWADQNQLKREEELINQAKCLPISFHTHPCPEHFDINALINQIKNFETSDQDLKQSKLKFIIEGEEILTPRILIVKEHFISNDIFTGVYDGFISKKRFDSSIKKVQKQNEDKIIDALNNIEFTRNQKIILGIGAVLLLIAIIRYRKYSLPVILALGVSIPLLLANTNDSSRPEYFNKVSEGQISIYIP